MGSIHMTQLLLILLIVVVLFGTKKLRTLGSDLGASIRSFKKALGEDKDPSSGGKQDSAGADADFPAQGGAKKDSPHMADPFEREDKKQE
jgi:sec-independent protein translocase protein TatA